MSLLAGRSRSQPIFLRSVECHGSSELGGLPDLRADLFHHLYDEVNNPPALGRVLIMHPEGSLAQSRSFMKHICINVFIYIKHSTGYQVSVSGSFFIHLHINSLNVY